MTHSHPGIYLNIDELIELRNLARDFTLEKSRRSRSVIEGSSRSAYRGRGMEFAEVRHYQPGDDVRNIDWRVTARTQTTFTKLFQEEKERPTYLLVDQRPCMFFGSQRQFKSVLAAKLASFVAWCAFQNNDRIGALIFSEAKQIDSRPKRGKNALLRFLQNLQQANTSLSSPLENNQGEHLSLEGMLTELQRVARPGSLIYIISDFHDLSANCEKTLSLLARHNDVELFHIYDPLEKALPKKALLTVTDGQQRATLNTHSQKMTLAYTENFEQDASHIKEVAIRCKSSYRALCTDTPIANYVQLFFKSTKGRMKSK